MIAERPFPPTSFLLHSKFDFANKLTLLALPPTSFVPPLLDFERYIWSVVVLGLLCSETKIGLIPWRGASLRAVTRLECKWAQSKLVCLSAG